ncbi:MAG: STAS domain-containing protein [Candidatus Omnitrophica bacterium]|nr:STAS domain-containing protein [Candidatus Omnitrophota bacterium]
MEFARRTGRGTGVNVIRCNNLRASYVVDLRNKMNRLMNRKNFRLVVDLGSARKMDAAGLGILVERLMRNRQQKGNVKLCSVRPEISRMMMRVGVNRVFEVFNTREEALNSFREM